MLTQNTSAASHVFLGLIVSHLVVRIIWIFDLIDLFSSQLSKLDARVFNFLDKVNPFWRILGYNVLIFHYAVSLHLVILGVRIFSFFEFLVSHLRILCMRIFNGDHLGWLSTRWSHKNWMNLLVLSLFMCKQSTFKLKMLTTLITLELFLVWIVWWGLLYFFSLISSSSINLRFFHKPHLNRLNWHLTLIRMGSFHVF